MKYGIYYAYWAHEWGADYTKYVEKVKRLGFDILEISCAGLIDMSEEEIRVLRKSAEDNDIILTSGYGPTAEQDLASRDPVIVNNAIDFWQKTFEVLEKLNIHLVGGGLYSYWPADYTKPVDKEGDLQRSIRNMQRVADIGINYGIDTLGMEILNRHEGYLLNTAAEGLNYVKAVDRKNVKVMLDTYHMLFEEDSITDAIHTAGTYLGHLHVGENNRKVPGSGNYINWKGLGKALHDINYDGTVVMEPFVIHGGKVGQDIRIWRDLLDDVSEKRLDHDAAASVKFLREAFA
jgi:D-psicose/D-tagatose/L-ribulose 3-epimerase